MKFKIGQQVECLIYGKGTIKEIGDERGYPITVLFKPGLEHCYTKMGQHFSNGRITLTPGTWEVKEVLPEPVFEYHQLVWVRDHEADEWRLRYYCACINNRHHVFMNNKIHDIESSYAWNYIKPFDGTDPYK